MAKLQLVADLPRPIAYVLAGGAAFGATQVGHLRALAQTDITPDFVVGTSVGSLNGAVLAEDPEAAPERLTELWGSVTKQEIFGSVVNHAVNVATGRPSATHNEGLQAFIERALTARTFEELAIPHTAMATDFDTGRAVSLDQDDLISALLASAAIPLVFPIVERKGRRLVDGGLVVNVPIMVAAGMGAQTIVVLDCGFTLMPPEREDTYGGRLLRTAAIMASQQVRRDLEMVTDRTVLYLPGPWPIRQRPDDFRNAGELASKTYGMTMAWLHALQINGPGRYGAAPTDALTKNQELPRPDPDARIPDH